MSLTFVGHHILHNGATKMDSESSDQQPPEQRPTPMIGNINSPSVSVASVSSDEHSNNPIELNTPVTTHGDPRHLHLELRKLTEALAKLRRTYQETAERPPEYTRSLSTERLGEMLGILRPLLTRYKLLQTPEVMGRVENLIEHVTQVYQPSALEFYEALDALRAALSHSVSEYVAADCGAGDTGRPPRTSASIVFPSYGDLHATDSEAETDLVSLSRRDTILSVDQVDAVLMRHDRGVDMALERAKIWSKYAKDVIIYVEKRIAIELDWAKNMAKLAQERRPVLKEESHLPFQSNYCIALDVDLEMCTKTQQTCSLLQDCKYIEPLKVQRTKHENARKTLRDKWNKERKRLQNAVIQLKKTKEIYNQRHQEYERCHEAVRIAEQGAEIGATAENKVDKRKRLEEDALQKATDSEAQYRLYVDEANDRHRNILLVKTEILRGVRELIVDCDTVMKDVTVNYFQQLHQLHNNLPDHYATLCESSRLYEPGNQFMEFVKTMPEAQVLHSTMSDPFHFESIDNIDNRHRAVALSARTKHDTYLEETAAGQTRRREAWTPSMGAIDPSDTESVESERSSPSGSPLVSSSTQPDHHHAGHPVIYFDNDSSTVDYGRSKMAATASSTNVSSDHETASSIAASAAAAAAQVATGIPTSPTTPPRRQIIPMSRAAISHRFRKIKTPSKCRECDTIVVYFNGFECSECGLSSHKKCLETLTLQCGHRRLPRKVAVFGVDLATHVAEAGIAVHIPTIVVKCVNEINERGLTVQGIYRVSGAKQRIDRLCQSFENGPVDLVDLTNIPPNVIADVLKNYMRQLPEPLLTNSLSPEFINVAETHPVNSAASTAALADPEVSSGSSQSCDPDEQARNKLRDLCRRLPKANYCTLGYLMHHLNKIASEHEANSMTASNLAIVYAPTLMKTNKEIGLGAVDETKHHARVIELLIVHATHIFGPPAELTAPSHLHRGGPNNPRVKNSRSRRSRGDSSDLFSSQTERRNDLVESEFSIPGLVHSSNDDGHVTAGSNEDIFGASVSDDDDDADPIPHFLLDESTTMRPGRSPMMRNSSPPLIIKQSLKNFSGLEGVTPGMLSTQDSLEVAQRAISGSSGHPTPTSPLVTQISAPTPATSEACKAKRTVHHEASMPVASTLEPVSSTAVFQKMGKVKHSIDCSDMVQQQQADNLRELERMELNSEPDSSSSSSRRLQRGGGGNNGKAEILNLEENRVTIQVPGVQSNPSVAVQRNHPATVVKQSSIDRDE